MNQQNKPRDITFLDIAFVAATLMMYSKTADVFVIFTPQIVTEMFGDIQQFYGMANAAIVEGVMVALHFHPRAAFSSKATTTKIILFVISAICQVYDSMVTTNTIAVQTETVKAIFTNGVPLITALVVALLLWIGKLPEAGYARKPWIGIKNWGKSLRWIIDGVGNYPASQQTMVQNALEVDREDLEEDEDLSMYEDENEDGEEAPANPSRQ